MVRTFRTEEAGAGALYAIFELMLDAFGTGFSGEDWQHTIGGVHFVVEQDGRPVSHASVIERSVSIGDRTLHTGYVEAVATHPTLQGTGLGTEVMRAVGRNISENFGLGALATGSHGFYARLGWETWDGPCGVRTADGWDHIGDEDGNVMILRLPTTPELEAGAPIITDWRVGDVW